MTKCIECGKRCSKFSSYCKTCYKAREDARLAKAREIVATGKCPICGEELKRNLSLSGWWQCAQLGAENFRKDPTKPSCGWQTFTQ